MEFNNNINLNNEEYISYLVKYTGNFDKNLVLNKDTNDVVIFPITGSNAVIYVLGNLIKNKDNTIEIREVFNSYFKTDLFKIIYVLPPEIYTLEQVSAIQASNVGSLQSDVALNLKGDGVVIGIIDTGIDYLSNEFKDSNGNTRINEIWDQSSGFKYINGQAILGEIYKSDRINEAIKAHSEGKNPYEIVPSKDDIGHGTNMAGIVGAAGYNPNIKGMAPNCEFVIVKMNPSEFIKEQFDIKMHPYNVTSIFLALEYLQRYALLNNKPLVILLPLGTNSGNHKGNNMLDSYISSISNNVGIVIVTGTGNEGVEDNHTSGIIKNKGDEGSIELLIEEREKLIPVQLWMGPPNIMEINIISPSGVESGYIPSILNISEKYSFVFEETQIHVYYSIPEEYTGDQLIRVYFQDIQPGIWKINVKLKLGKDAEYNAWISQTGLTLSKNRFISTNQYGTITTPGDSVDTVTVAAYNQNNDNLLAYSGVAFRDRPIIDFAAGGYNTITVGINNSIDVISGTSLSAAIGAGACALLFQWGIINKNFPNMYSRTLKTLLNRGVRRRAGDIYPSPQLGNGILDLYKVFQNMS